MRRERWTILGDILAAVDEAEASGREAVLTRVAMVANLPHDRLVPYLQHLASTGLVADSARPKLTPSGRDFLRRYREWLEVLARFGLDASSFPPERPAGEAMPSPPSGAARGT
jgi:predicted transcriptional regulator